MSAADTNWPKTREEMARHLKISVPTLDRLRYAGEIGYVAIGTRVLFTERHAEELLARKDRKARESTRRRS